MRISAQQVTLRLARAYPYGEKRSTLRLTGSSETLGLCRKCILGAPEIHFEAARKSSKTLCQRPPDTSGGPLVFTAGFDFVEPEAGPNVGAKFSDGRFNLTLKLGEQSLRELAFSPPNDVAPLFLPGVRQ